MSAQGVDAQNLVEIDSAVMNLRMREKTRFRVDFFVNISIYPVYRRGYMSHFWTILTHNGSNEVLSQPMVPFKGLYDTF